MTKRGRIRYSVQILALRQRFRRCMREESEQEGKEGEGYTSE